MKTGFLLLLTCTLGCAADWLTSGGDPQRTGWQTREHILSNTNVKGMQLLWKRRLDGPAPTTPTMLGPIVTHRGIKELVFIADASDTVYAVDADLGRLFWKRHLEGGSRSTGACGGLTATPVIPPAVNVREDQEFTTMRPLYVLSSDGRLRTIRPSDGEEIAPARNFVPPNSKPSSLNILGSFVYTSAGCAKGVWAIDVNKADAKPISLPSADGTVAAGMSNEIYARSGRRILKLERDTLRVKDSLTLPAEPAATVPFQYAGQELVAAMAKDGRVFVRGAEDANTSGSAAGIATYADAGGKRWLYCASGKAVRGLQVSGPAAQPKLNAAWTWRGAGPALSPVVANGVVYVLCREAEHAVLYALDADSGKELYSSGTAVQFPVSSSGLALANGHVCFSTDDGTLYCFGLPIEM